MRFCESMLRRAVAAYLAGLALVITWAGAAPASRPTASSGVLDVGDRRQVFIDGRFIARSENVELVVHPPRKTGERTITSDRSWEGGIGMYNSVLHHDGTYHMWYRSGGTMCYARSKDGVAWEKPALGLAEVKGTRDNNVVIGHGAGGAEDAGQGAMVFLDPTASPQERFRMALRVAAPGKDVNLYSSPDGIHWKLTHPAILTYNSPVHHLDSQNVIFWDDRISKYVAYMRQNMRVHGSQGRAIARSESPKLGGFAEAQDADLVLAHDEEDAKLGASDVVDYYTSAAIKYPWAQDAYYMFPTAYLHYIPGAFAEFREQAPVNAGPLHTQFAASRDGVTWERFDRRPFVDLGFRGSFDSMTARVFYGMVPSVDGNELYLYYVASDIQHGWGRDDRNNRLLTEAGLAPQRREVVISRVVARMDGFISARAAYTGGEFTTPPMRFKGRELVLNVDTSATGLLRCELQDEQGTPIDGFKLEDCDLVHTSNEIHRVMRWKGISDVSRLAGQPVRLRVSYRDADVYTFQFRG